MSSRWVCITDGRGHFLRSHGDGRISFEGTGFGPASIFLRKEQGGRKVAFKNMASKLYLATNDHSETGQDAEIGERQTWRETDRGDQGVALLGFNNQYLNSVTRTTVQFNGDGTVVRENPAYTSSDEIRLLQYVDPPKDMLPDSSSWIERMIPDDALPEKEPDVDIGRLLDAGVLKKNSGVLKSPRVTPID